MPKHVLVVDDDRDVRDVLIEILNDNGFVASSADSGTAMRDFLNSEHIPVDAVVLDCMMPGETSAKLAIHAKQLRLPVVMISGSPEAIEFAEENELQILQKPFQINDLLNALQIAMASGKFGQRSVGR